MQLLTSVMPLSEESFAERTLHEFQSKQKNCKVRQYRPFKADFGSYTPIYVDNKDRSTERKTPFPCEFPPLGISVSVGKCLLCSFRIDDLAICKAATEEQRGKTERQLLFDHTVRCYFINVCSNFPTQTAGYSACQLARKRNLMHVLGNNE